MLHYIVEEGSYAATLMRGEIRGVARRRFSRDDDKLVVSVVIDGS